MKYTKPNKMLSYLKNFQNFQYKLVKIYSRNTSIKYITPDLCTQVPSEIIKMWLLKNSKIYKDI